MPLVDRFAVAPVSELCVNGLAMWRHWPVKTAQL